MANSTKNLCGKSRKIDNPYAIFRGRHPLFGDIEYRILKTYQKPALESKNAYARWMVAAKSDMTYGSWDMGDTYVHEVLRSANLEEASPEWEENYQVSLSD